MSILLPDYTALERQLSVAGAAIAPSELHGVLCGLLCVAGREAATQWLGEQLESFIGHERDVDAVCLTLEELELASWSALSGSELQFNPVLPDEDVDLAERTAALGQWCLGFIGGLALGGWNDLDVGEYSDEVNEIVRDFSAISNAGIGRTATTYHSLGRRGINRWISGNSRVAAGT
jgi:uncharacterized protein